MRPTPPRHSQHHRNRRGGHILHWSELLANHTRLLQLLLHLGLLRLGSPLLSLQLRRGADHELERHVRLRTRQ